MIEKYNLKDPIESDEVGAFTSEVMQKLYNDLVEKGNKSVVDALEVGMTIEDLDIYDLEKFMSETENADILKVYTSLNNASMKHMNAFNRQLEKEGVTYLAQYITQERMEEILADSGNSQGGKGQGGGHGKGENKGYESSNNEVVVKAQNNEQGFF